MTMKTFLSSSIFFLLSALLPSFVHSATIPNADTPLFYLVATSASSPNLLSLRIPGGSGTATLLGSGPPAQFYFWQGQLTILDPDPNNNYNQPYHPLINTNQDANGCQNFGALQFVQGSDTNKCASYASFQLQSNGQDSQLGAQLVFNYVGGFFSCSSGNEVWYKINPNDGPSNCVPINLYTVPVY